MVWLSRVLWGARSTPGHQRIGKHRKVVKMTATRRRNLEKREQIQQDVMFQLSRPYLTQEQELGTARERRSEYVPKWVRNMRHRWMNRQTGAFNELQGTNR